MIIENRNPNLLVARVFNNWRENTDVNIITNIYFKPLLATEFERERATDSYGIVNVYVFDYDYNSVLSISHLNQYQSSDRNGTFDFENLYIFDQSNYLVTNLTWRSDEEQHTPVISKWEEHLNKVGIK